MSEDSLFSSACSKQAVQAGCRLAEHPSSERDVCAWRFRDASSRREVLLEEASCLQITLNVPERYLIDAEPDELARRILLYAAER